MDNRPNTELLAGTKTIWWEVRLAHGDCQAARAAQESLLRRYRDLVFRYLLGATHDEQLAEELTQEFCVKFLRGDFRRANPKRGRFRDLLRTSLSRMVIDHHRRQRRQPVSLEIAPPFELPATGQTEIAAEEAFVKLYRNHLLTRCWAQLRAEEQRTGQPLHLVLYFAAHHSDLTSPELAQQLGSRLGRQLTADWVRKWLRLARAAFADALVAEVGCAAQSPDEIEAELAELGLLNDACRAALKRLRNSRDAGSLKSGSFSYPPIRSRRFSSTESAFEA